MPRTAARIVYVNGSFLYEDQARISIFDRGFLFADGVYEVTAVLNGRMIDNERHLRRLGLSMQKIGLAAPASEQEITTIQNRLIALNNLRNGRIYLQVTRGAADRDFLYPKEPEPSLIMFTQEAAFPKETPGISVVTVPDIRWKRRDIKTIGLLPASMAKEEARSRGADDAWMVEDGVITEGTSNNAYIVTKDGKIITRQLGHEILPGITRQAVLELAAHEGLLIEERPFTVEEAENAQEAFVTSANAFVTGVVRINGRVLSDGTPGPVTQKLRGLYLAMARGEA